MTHTITIQTQDDTDFALLKSLAQRLGLRIEEDHQEMALSQSQENALLEQLAGGWQSEESGEQLAAMLQTARHFRSREQEL
ncbi:hypothetical protein [Fibrella forsythiae]|uniref:Uncharacterized protein n=1 Tax=Fibrella forsythiae TaxID=2817061 RepID=A0ABS3JSM2_9BACT|nr:hypothetical protein [Fibrella forsythiae]MBO0953015.1 hypothetical protein [Fibrella forsythiae]